MGEQLSRWEDRREIQNLMGKLSAHYVLRKEEDAIRYWSRRDDICLGVNDGWYAGRDAICAYYAAFHARTALQSRLIAAAFPEQAAGKTEEELYGVGMMSYKPLDTAVIVVADDGMTAKGLWYCRGSYSELTPGGPVAFWEWAWFAVDFIWEEGAWRIWHMLNVQEVNAPCGRHWGEPYELPSPVPEFAAVAEFKLPEPNIKAVNRVLYSAARPFTRTPRLPEPYATFSETFSYGCDCGAADAPAGHRAPPTEFDPTAPYPYKDGGTYTAAELVGRVQDREAIKDVMFRRAYYQTNGDHREELNDLWVKTNALQNSASLATNFGYYVGMEEIERYYVHQFAETRYEQLAPYVAAGMALAGRQEDLGFGIMELHTCNTPMVYIADDGKTAKFLGYDCGAYSIGQPDGSVKPYFLLGLLYADLVKEDGAWKLWHLQLRHDHSIEPGSDYSAVPAVPGLGNDDLEEVLGGKDPTIPHMIDPFFGWVDMPKIMPKPYRSFTEDRSYGPGYLRRDRREEFKG